MTENGDDGMGSGGTGKDCVSVSVSVCLAAETLWFGAEPPPVARRPATANWPPIQEPSVEQLNAGTDNSRRLSASLHLGQISVSTPPRKNSKEKKSRRLLGLPCNGSSSPGRLVRSVSYLPCGDLVARIYMSLRTFPSGRPPVCDPRSIPRLP